MPSSHLFLITSTNYIVAQSLKPLFSSQFHIKQLILQFLICAWRTSSTILFPLFKTFIRFDSRTQLLTSASNLLSQPWRSSYHPTNNWCQSKALIPTFPTMVNHPLASLFSHLPLDSWVLSEGVLHPLSLRAGFPMPGPTVYAPCLAFMEVLLAVKTQGSKWQKLTLWLITSPCVCVAISLRVDACRSRGTSVFCRSVCTHPQSTYTI